MADTSRAVFGRYELPQIAIIRAGAHFPERAQRTLDQFDTYSELKGSWLPYSYCEKDGKEILVVFGVYGGAPTLEVIRILEEGGVQMIGFIGSAFSKKGKIGEQLLVTRVFDQAGVTRMDGVEVIDRAPELVVLQHDFLIQHEVEFSQVSIASVPCVMHGIETISEFIQRDEVDGVEMELSTYFHFTKDAGMKAVANLYVSDNPKYEMLDDEVSQLREDGMILSSQLVIDLLLKMSLTS